MSTPSLSPLRPKCIFLVIWILSICTVQVRSQPAQPTLTELSSTVQQLLGRFNHFQAYVEQELNKLRTTLTYITPNGQLTSDLELTGTKVTLNQAKDMATYTINYKAIKQPRIIWRINSEPSDDYNHDARMHPSESAGLLDGAITDEGTITKTFRNGVGETTLNIHVSREIVASIIVDHVTYVLSFRANPTAPAETKLKPTKFHVQSGPHGSISYQKGQPMQIQVSSPKYYQGFSSPPDYQWSFWMANTTANPPVMEEYPQWRQIQGGVVRVGPIRTLRKHEHHSDLRITYELMTDKGDYDGILIFSKYYTSTDPTSVITGLTEMRYVFVHRSDRYDPYPNGFIAFVRRDPPMKPCSFNKTCSIACHAVGVIPERIHLYKVQIDNSLMEVNLPKLEVREPYMLYAHYGIKMMVEEDEGEYICYAFSGTTHTEIRTTLLLSEPVEFVNSTSGVLWGQGTVTVTCAAKGRPLPHITMFENYAYQNEIRTMHPSYHVDRTVNRVNGDHIVTMRVTITLDHMPRHLWRVICMVDNPFQITATDYMLRDQPMRHGPAPPGPPPPRYPHSRV